MRTLDRIVVDTNVFVSAIILPLSIPRQAVDRALDRGVLLSSDATIHELADVLFRPKLNHFAGREDRELFLTRLNSTAEFVPILQVVRECRDPRDDKFLELALNGRADVIITGDTDLRALNPWRGVAILSPADYLER